MIPQNPEQSTPLYKPDFNPGLSPREMWKELEKPPEKPKRKRKSKTPQYIEQENQTAYKSLTSPAKELRCAGIVLSANWRTFLKPLLEEAAVVKPRPIKCDEDYYKLLADNAVAAHVTNLITHLETAARRSPAYNHEEEPS